MKKRLLITSIVMMLVVAVALSTATYAWFTSNSSVQANAVLLTAAVADGDAIMITHDVDATTLNAQIDLASAGTSTLYPATPKAATSLTTFDSWSAIGGNFQNLIMKGDGNYTDPSSDEGYAATNVSCYHDTFYVFNKGTKDVTLVPTIKIYYDNTTISTKAAQSARIALVERVGTQANIGSNVTFSGSYLLKGIYQWDTTAASTEEEYVSAAELTFDAAQTYYTEDNEIYTADSTVTSSNWDSKKSTLYIKKFTNTAVAGANGTYGATESPASSGKFVKGSISFTPDAGGMSAIGTPASGKHIANEYSVIVWLEGWDDDCTNAITAGAFRVDIGFTVAA